MNQTSLCASPGTEPTMLYELEELNFFLAIVVLRDIICWINLEYNCFFHRYTWRHHIARIYVERLDHAHCISRTNGSVSTPREIITVSGRAWWCSSSSSVMELFSIDSFSFYKRFLQSALSSVYFQTIPGT